MKTTYILLPILTVFLLACSGLDDMEYIEAPKANQISDLQDDDRDGVINARDTCPATPEKSQVDNEGCGERIRAEEERQLNILFANDSYEVNPLFSDQITSMAEFLKTYQSTTIEIRGYASKIGSSEYNLKLSKKRALRVEEELLSNGINPNRVRIVGYGEEDLEHKGDDATAHALNRRVTATVVGLSEQVVEEWTIFTTLKK